MRRSEVKSERSTNVRSRCCFLPGVKGHFGKKRRGGGAQLIGRDTLLLREVTHIMYNSQTTGSY